MATAPVRPVVPELDGAGTKRLWKTRYEILENMYVQQNVNMNRVLKDREEYRSCWEQEQLRAHQLSIELKRLKADMADSEVVMKKMQVINKELKLGLNLKMFNTMEDRLNAFFGTILTMIRTPEAMDELAE